jgi:hypothetical protein
VKEGINLPRYPSVPGRLRAKKKEVERIAVATASAGPAAAAGATLGPSMVVLRLPEEQRSEAEIIGRGADAAPAVVDLLGRIGVLWLVSGPIVVFVEHAGGRVGPRLARSVPRSRFGWERAAAPRSRRCSSAAATALRVARALTASRRPTSSTTRDREGLCARRLGARGRARRPGCAARLAPGTDRGQVLAHAAARLGLPLAANVCP